VGGVVGGLAAVGLLVGGALFILLARAKNKAAADGGALATSSSTQQTVSETEHDYNAPENQPPTVAATRAKALDALEA